MKVFIQSTKTKAFYAGEGQWVAKHVAAKDWKSSMEAKRAISRENLENTSIVRTFMGEKGVVLMPLWIKRAG